MELLLLLALGAAGIYAYTLSTSKGGEGGGTLPPYVTLTNWAGDTVQHIAKDQSENGSLKRSTGYYNHAVGVMTDDGKLATTGDYTATPAVTDVTIASVLQAQMSSLGADTHSIVMSLSDISALLNASAPAPKTLTVFMVPNDMVAKLANQGSSFAVVD